eukprot:4401405-Pyramimonas_sp.AAC.1
MHLHQRNPISEWLEIRNLDVEIDCEIDIGNDSGTDSEGDRKDDHETDKYNRFSEIKKDLHREIARAIY